MWYIHVKQLWKGRNDQQQTNKHRHSNPESNRKYYETDLDFWCGYIIFVSTIVALFNDRRKKLDNFFLLFNRYSGFAKLDVCTLVYTHTHIQPPFRLVSNLIYLRLKSIPTQFIVLNHIKSI